MSTLSVSRYVDDLWFDVGGYTVRRMTAGEAGELPDGFRAVYGEDYLSARVYDAAALAQVVAGGAQVSYLARSIHERALNFPLQMAFSTSWRIGT
ncbi:hypothetical protein CKO28_07975 [Rhodovibrio sodomensis]|uniref:Uncharacterized protein n=1 Tax=Rhodovibrio sodomensis TaxID=1088 RepID=A0ABS1DDG4_9PROT|nr:hypothetical protein [Rhodovibrio sodomensis]MBK1667972.1 hypothetical protein [Rhodovibrio sodomensis]